VPQPLSPNVGVPSPGWEKAYWAAPGDDARFNLESRAVLDHPEDSQRYGTSLLTARAARRRALGADLLGQLASVKPSAQIVDLLVSRLEQERNPVPLSSLVVACGHARAASGRRQIADLVRHPDSKVRFAVAWALPLVGLDRHGIRALVALSCDRERQVRDWATFGLAESSSRARITIGALRARSADRDRDTRAEAIWGLARRRDVTASPLVELELLRDDVGELVQRAQKELQSSPQSRGARKRTDFRSSIQGTRGASTRIAGSRRNAGV